MENHRESIAELVMMIYDTVNNMNVDEERRFYILVMVTSLLLYNLEKEKPEEGMLSVFANFFKMQDVTNMREQLGQIPEEWRNE